MSGQQDRANRVHISVNRLISQIIPSDPGLSEEDNQDRHDMLFEAVRERIERLVVEYISIWPGTLLTQLF